MKISYRILLINFAIVVLILSSSALAFYSIMFEVLTSQESKFLLNSANNLVYTLREVQQEWLDDLLYKDDKNTSRISDPKDIHFIPKNIDFILTDNGNGNVSSLVTNQQLINIPLQPIFTLDDFRLNNPFTIIYSYKDNSGRAYFFGKVISTEFLDFLSKRINSEIALITAGIPVVLSNDQNNKRHLKALMVASRELERKENYKLYAPKDGSSDILATTYKMTDTFGNHFQFLVFTSISEASGLRDSIQSILIIIGSAGVILSLILTFLFTDKIRKQITLLSRATKVSKDGNFLNKIMVKSKDELGQLAASFNEMIDELEKSQKAKNEYSEFLTLLNQNPSLIVISDAVLKKIIKSCGLTAGALYSVYNEEISLTSSFGTKSGIGFKENNDLFYTVARDKEPIELVFESDSPVISSGIYNISIKYLLVYPVIYNNTVIAILELAGTETSSTVKSYLANIQDQLAIGLTNAGAFVQLENLVSELKLLNEEYQKQNIQIRKQNDTLTELHRILKEKADELEIETKKAEESAKLKSQFLAAVSHELRTPMNSILGLTELILNDRSLEKKNRDRLEVVLKNGNRLMNLINEILDLSKIEAGKMEVYLEDLTLEEVISTAVSTISTLAANKNLKFIVKRETDTNVIINSDKEKINQVLINLLDNAVKFTEKGSVVLSVFLEQDRLKFTVTDTGIGVSKKDLEYIFNEFRQVDGSNSRMYGGTGLGLTICKRIAELLNGYISVESDLRKGSVFTFVIPVVISGTSKSPERKANTGTGKTVLVVDDDPEMRYTIGQYLVSRNYEVVFLENENEVIDTVRRVKPFAVTLDAFLPDYKSWDLLLSLKQNPETSDIPLILLSILGDINAGYAIGAFDYLSGSLTNSKLDNIISKVESLIKKKTERVLILGNKPESAELKINNQKNLEIIRIEEDINNLFRRICENNPDIIIADLLDTIPILHMLKSRKETRHIPLILSIPENLSGNDKEILNSGLEDLTIKSKGHPLDVLKIIRDRIEIQEISLKSKKTQDEYDTDNKTHAESEELLGEVLIVDDDADTLFTLNEIVKACNCSTILAKSGKECIELLEHKSPDLILLDIMMPEIDGFQTLKKIRRKKRSENIPVFAVTAKAMAEDKEIILKHGFDDYISKPVNSGVIAFKIEKLLSKLKIV